MAREIESNINFKLSPEEINTKNSTSFTLRKKHSSSLGVATLHYFLNITW